MDGDFLGRVENGRATAADGAGTPLERNKGSQKFPFENASPVTQSMASELGRDPGPKNQENVIEGDRGGKF